MFILIEFYSECKGFSGYKNRNGKLKSLLKSFHKIYR